MILSLFTRLSQNIESHYLSYIRPYCLDFYIWLNWFYALVISLGAVQERGGDDAVCSPNMSSDVEGFQPREG